MQEIVKNMFCKMFINIECYSKNGLNAWEKFSYSFLCWFSTSVDLHCIFIQI